MTIFDLLFAVLFLTGVGSLTVASIAAVRGRRARALTIARRVGVVAALYFGVVIVVSAFSPQRFVRLGEDQCSDDWCIAVQAVRIDTLGSDTRYEVTFRLSNRARRAPQRERFVAAYLRDTNGHRYAAVRDAAASPFDTLLAAAQTVSVIRRFTVPADARVVGLVVTREGSGRFPRCCIVGDQGSVFHRPAIVKLN
jgi:hypothetical protein